MRRSYALRRGRPVAALVPADDLRLLERLEDVADLRAAAGAMANPENAVLPIPWDDLKRELDRRC